MNNNQLIIIILVILVLLYIIKCCLKSKEEIVIEQFDDTTKKINKDYELNNIEKNYYIKINNDDNSNINTKTVFDLISVNENTKKPTISSVISIFPVNIIYYPQNNEKNIEGTYLAVFNDGALYKTNNLLRGNWEGPLINSYPINNNNEYIFLRHINLSKNGDILGVGYDGNVYNKKDKDITDDSNNKEPYYNEWELWNTIANLNISFILYNKYNEDETIEQYFVLDNNNIKLYNYQNNMLQTTTAITITLQNPEKIYRMYYDIDDKLLFINENRELKRIDQPVKEILNKNNIPLTISVIDEKDKNPNILYDIIYHTDGTLLGVGSFNDDIRLLKQDVKFHYLYPFKLINNLMYNDKESTNVISKEKIALLKSGYSKKKTKDFEKQKINTIEDAYQIEVDKDLQNFKKFCSEKSNNQYINLKLLNNINNFQHKIEKLKELKKELVNLDKFNIPPIQ